LDSGGSCGVLSGGSSDDDVAGVGTLGKLGGRVGMGACGGVGARCGCDGKSDCISCCSSHVESVIVSVVLGASLVC
jgi:hypothetical protein